MPPCTTCGSDHPCPINTSCEFAKCTKCGERHLAPKNSTCPLVNPTGRIVLSINRVKEGNCPAKIKKSSAPQTSYIKPEKEMKAAGLSRKTRNENGVKFLEEARPCLNYKFWESAGNDKEKNKVFMLLRDAGKHGHPEAFFWLGKCYQFGYGTTSNKIEARKWYKLYVSQYNHDIFKNYVFNRLKELPK